MRFRTTVILLFALVRAAPPAAGAEHDSLSVTRDTSATSRPRRESRVYFGGSLGISVSGRLVLVTVQPQIGYKLTPKTSLGARLGYEYVQDRRYEPAHTTSNVGIGVFGRYRLHPQAFAHAEFEAANLDLAGGREWVPFLWLGGGYARPLAPKTWLVVEVLVDVLRDGRSPSYRQGDPRVSVGVVVGF